MNEKKTKNKFLLCFILDNSFFLVIIRYKFVYDSQKESNIMNTISNGNSKRPQHDRSRHLKEYENSSLIQLIEKEDGVVSYIFAYIYLKKNNEYLKFLKLKDSCNRSHSAMAIADAVPQQLE